MTTIWDVVTKTKVIFLDCDGVMNSIDHMIRCKGEFDNPKNQMDPEAVVRLNQITDATGAVLVISSVWRLLSNVDQLQRIMKAYKITGQVIDATPKDVASGEGSRELEILAWLAVNPTEQFIVIDDEGMNKLREHHVHPKMQHGIQDEHVAQAIALLKDK